ncbi:SDR family oxidoreductase [Leucobacter zeae]|nr:SDR family oxidoreductase [Leucobacter zeae]
MRILIVGASTGLGRALVRALSADGHEVTGVSRTRPPSFGDHWIEADFTRPATAAQRVADASAVPYDVIVWNLGVWEPTAFSPDYRFDAQPDDLTEDLIAANLTGLVLALRRLVPDLVRTAAPRIILTGSTSGLPRSGRPEVAFGATKAALNGVADALREHYRAERLSVTTLQLGDLNTEDDLDVPRAAAAARGDGALIPLHDVVDIVRTILGLSGASFVREIVMPAILDERF